MRDLTNGRATIDVKGGDVRELIEAIDLAYPGVKERLYESDQLRKDLVVLVDGRASRLGLSQRVTEGSEIRFLSSISGG
jgi:molybdopterin converting factor small subunit